MDRLIREMSYLFTKSRFDELQERAEEISIDYCWHIECFGSVADAIEKFVEETPANEGREHEKIITHYMVMRGLALYGDGEQITKVQWAHPGWMGTAEKGDTIQ